MIYLKMVRGFVAQSFDSETGDCVRQEFFPDETSAAERQDEAGTPIPEIDQVELANTEKPCSLDMVQP